MTAAEAEAKLSARRAELHSRFVKLWAKRVLAAPETALVPLKERDALLASSFEVGAQEEGRRGGGVAVGERLCHTQDWHGLNPPLPTTSPTVSVLLPSPSPPPRTCLTSTTSCLRGSRRAPAWTASSCAAPSRRYSTCSRPASRRRRRPRWRASWPTPPSRCPSCWAPRSCRPAGAWHVHPLAALLHCLLMHRRPHVRFCPEPYTHHQNLPCTQPIASYNSGGRLPSEETTALTEHMYTPDRCAHSCAWRSLGAPMRFCIPLVFMCRCKPRSATGPVFSIHMRRPNPRRIHPLCRQVPVL